LRRLRAFLRGHHRIGLDTSVFIHQLEANPHYVELTDAIFAWVEEPGHSAVTSTLTMLELVVLPYRQSSERRVDEFYGLLATYPHLEWIAQDLEIADAAARIRAAHRLRTPDAVQAATAIRAGASGIITNDAVLGRVDGVEMLVLDELLAENQPTV
jgi:predicted nucleic acid-binding protein